MTEDRIALLEFRKKLDEIRQARGRGTELISLYVPPGKQICDIMAYLRNESAESGNIKSSQTRNHVQDAIESLLSRLRMYKAPPRFGLAMFVGHATTGNDTTSMVAYVIELPDPISLTKPLYRCDSAFYLDPLEELTKEKNEYGLIVIDRSEATIGLLIGKRIVVIKYKQSMVPNKHGRGGQSQRRFERITEIEAHKWYKTIAELAEKSFLERNLKGILIGGPGPTKEYFNTQAYLHHELQKIVVDTFDIGYTDESGLRELIDKASPRLQELSLIKEQQLVEKFKLELVRGTSGLAEYGVQKVEDALGNGTVDMLLVSEALDLDRINSLRERAERFSTTVELISTDSEQGAMLMNTFKGVVAILRYRR